MVIGRLRLAASCCVRHSIAGDSLPDAHVARRLLQLARACGVGVSAPRRTGSLEH